MCSTILLHHPVRIPTVSSLKLAVLTTLTEDPPQHTIYQQQALRDVQISRVVQVDVLSHRPDCTDGHGHHSTASRHR